MLFNVFINIFSFFISECEQDQFACSNGLCKPQMWVCDRVNDCGDGSDEKACSMYFLPLLSCSVGDTVTCGLILKVHH